MFSCTHEHVSMYIETSCTGGGGLGTPHMYSFVYVAHPMKVTGMAWRKTSSFMPKYIRNHNLACVMLRMLLKC